MGELRQHLLNYALSDKIVDDVVVVDKSDDEAWKPVPKLLMKLTMF